MYNPQKITEKATLGEKIRTYRERVGISQFNLELEADMQSGSICRIEKGIINPSKETIIKLAKALNLTQLEVADLFEIDIVHLLSNHKQKTQDD